MSERMPTTLPSPADRSKYRFVALDESGVAWCWIDEEEVWVRLGGETGPDDLEVDACDVLH